MCSLILAAAAQGCASAPVRGRVVGERQWGGTHEVPDTVFDVELVNEGQGRCELVDYTVAWGSGILAGKRTCRAKVVMPPGATSRQECVVPSETQLGATPGLGRARVIEVNASCGAPR